MSWMEPAAGDAHALRYASLGPEGWSAPRQVAAGNDWFINQADFPSVVPIDAEHWAAHWLVRRPGGTYSYDIALALSDDRGRRWREPLTPHRDGTATEHGFVSLFPWLRDTGAVWLDGRNMVPDKGGAPRTELATDGGMSLRYARLSHDGEILADGEIDDRVCECCQTDVALTDSGPVVAYRDRSPDEIRDIAVSRYTNDRWTEPLIVSDDRWQIAGCPVNGPAIAAKGDRVVVAWYGAPNRQRRVKVAWSKDAGATFAAPVVLDEGGARGRVDVELLGADRAIVSWVARTGKETGQLRVREVAASGDMRPMQVIADGSYSRSSGFPQMIRAGTQLVLAWPEAGDPARVLTSLARLDTD
ncbi:MAG: exo-alpha-sialidase [Chromatiales bacterium]|nr:MAG: exo-alpha-sialidase [Chromatiales bacterium]